MVRTKRFVVGVGVVLCCALGCGDSDPDPVSPPGTDGPVPRTSCPAGLLQPRIDTNVTGNGPASLGADDTDGNGILDRDEWGPLEWSPLDTDDDGIADHEDTDDDDDGLSDLYDADRTGALSFEAPAGPESFGLLTGAWTEIGEARAPLAGRVGDPIVLSGTGLSCECVVSFGTATGPVAVAPLAVGPSDIVATVPEGATGGIAVELGGRRSTSVNVAMVGPGGPIVAAAAAPSAAVGTAIVLSGRGLGGVDRVLFGQTEVAPLAVSDETVEVVVPAGATCDTLQVAGGALSNEVPLRVTAPATAEVALPETVVAPPEALVVLGADDEQVALDSAGLAPIQIRALGSTVVQVLQPSEAGPVVLLEALSIPGEAVVRIDSLSSAVALAVQVSGAARKIALESLGDLRQLAGEIPEVQSLAGHIDRSLVAPDIVWNAPNADTAERVRVAALALQQTVDQAVTDGTLTERASTDYEARDGDLQSAPIPEAEFEPDGPQDDVALSQIPGTTNIRVTNDTQLYLSVSIHDTGEGRVLVPHARWPYDSNIVGGEGPVSSLFAAQVKDFNHPRGRDARVEVVTPGILHPQPDTIAGKRAQAMLRLRTVVEKIIWPILNEVLDAKVKPELLTQIFMAQAHGMVAQFHQSMDQGEADQAVLGLLAGLKSDIQTGGPITKALIGDVGPAVIEKISEAAATRLVPILGQIKTVIDAMGKVFTAVETLRAIADIVFTDGSLTWNVTFGLGITKLVPTEMTKEHYDQRFDLLGNGFFPKNVGGNHLFPMVTFTDTEPTGFGTSACNVHGLVLTPGDPIVISRDGTKMNGVKLEAAAAAYAVGPIKLHMVHDGETATAPNRIQVETDFKLTSLTPPNAKEDEEIVVAGGGFINDVRFGFYEPNANNATADAEIISHTADSATIRVPDLPTQVTAWLVRAKRRQGPGDLRTNGLPFALEPESYRLLIIGEPGSKAVHVNNLGVVLISQQAGSDVRAQTWTEAGGRQDVADSSSGDGFLHADGLVQIGESGTILGAFPDPGNPMRHLFASGNATALETPAALRSGQGCAIVGFSAIAQGDQVGGWVDCGHPGFTPDAWASRWNPGHSYLAPDLGLWPYPPSGDGYRSRDTRVYGMNDSGTGAGEAEPESVPSGMPAIFSGAVTQELPMPPGAWQQGAALDINNSGVAVGGACLTTQNPCWRALLWSNVSSPPTVIDSIPIVKIIDVSNTGILLGSTLDLNMTHRIGEGDIYVSYDHQIWTQVGGSEWVDVDGTMVRFNTAYAVNDAGIIVGSADTLSSGTVAVALIPNTTP